MIHGKKVRILVRVGLIGFVVVALCLSAGVQFGGRDREVGGEGIRTRELFTECLISLGAISKDMDLFTVSREDLEELVGEEGRTSEQSAIFTLQPHYRTHSDREHL